jgi:hypothetical protein
MRLTSATAAAMPKRVAMTTELSNPPPTVRIFVVCFQCGAEGWTVRTVSPWEAFMCAYIQDSNL